MDIAATFLRAPAGWNFPEVARLLRWQAGNS
jgi:hypothetical protein